MEVWDLCVCVCVCVFIRMCSQSKLFVRGGEGEVWGVGDCDPIVLSCILLCSKYERSKETLMIKPYLHCGIQLGSSGSLLQCLGEFFPLLHLTRL